MSYDHKVIEFYGDPINFFINNNSVMVGSRSVCDGIGISWSGQFERIKSLNIIRSCSRIRMNGKQINKIITVLRGDIPTWFGSIDKKKYGEERADRIELYQDEFYQFCFKSLETENQIEQEDIYLGSKDGLRQLINDSVIKLGNENAIDQIVNTIYPLISEDIVGDTSLPLIEKEKSPRITKAHDIHIDRIRNTIINLPNPIIDMAEKTASRKNELAKLKSKSIGSRIEEIAEKIKDLDRKSSLQLKVIAKSLY